MSAISLASAQQSFTATLPAVEDAVRFAFRRRLRPQEYEEALAEARAAAWSAWHGLIQHGKDPVQIGVHGIAANAVRWVRARRKVGNTNCGRGAMDVFHPKAQKACGFALISLDSGGEFDPGDSTRGPWRQWLVEDHRVGPADLACSRVDLVAWMGSLTPRRRAIARAFAYGHDGVTVARMVGVSAGRVCQVRRELAVSWEEFQRQATDPESSEVGSGRPARAGDRGMARV